MSTSTSDANTAGSAVTAPRKRRFFFKLVLFTLLAVAAAGGYALYLLRSEPEHWKRNRAFFARTAPAEVKRIAGDVQSKLLAHFDPAAAAALAAGYSPETLARLAEVARARGLNADDLSQLHFSVDELNAWLRENLAEWMNYNGYVKPNEIADPMLAIEQGKLIAAFAYTSPRFSQIFSASFDATIHGDGTASMKLGEVTAGNLPLPGGSIASAMKDRAGGASASDIPGASETADSAERAGAWLDKLDDVKFKPILKLAPGKKIEVLAYQLNGAGVDLTIRTFHPEPVKVAAAPTK